ncbi:MAG: ATP-binding protein, partial [Deltaproteobacteria bacterium]|nr:ATP-binding protein [Deltaproteobacteria bacterium]
MLQKISEGLSNGHNYTSSFIVLYYSIQHKLIVKNKFQKNRVYLNILLHYPFEEWGEIFNDDVVASVILDRILHHCYPFFIQGKSYRT